MLRRRQSCGQHATILLPISVRHTSCVIAKDKIITKLDPKLQKRLEQQQEKLTTGESDVQEAGASRVNTNIVVRNIHVSGRAPKMSVESVASSAQVGRLRHCFGRIRSTLIDLWPDFCPNPVELAPDCSEWVQSWPNSGQNWSGCERIRPVSATSSYTCAGFGCEF